MRHPDIRVYSQVTGGRIPASDQYQAIIDAVRYLRREKGLDDRGLVAYLRPFWKSWGERKRQDGRPYGGGNISWLTEWALNDSMPEKTANEMTVQERTESFFGKS